MADDKQLVSVAETPEGPAYFYDDGSVEIVTVKSEAEIAEIAARELAEAGPDDYID